MILPALDQEGGAAQGAAGPAGVPGVEAGLQRGEGPHRAGRRDGELDAGKAQRLGGQEGQLQGLRWEEAADHGGIDAVVEGVVVGEALGDLAVLHRPPQGDILTGPQGQGEGGLNVVQPLHRQEVQLPEGAVPGQNIQVVRAPGGELGLPPAPPAEAVVGVGKIQVGVQRDRHLGQLSGGAVESAVDPGPDEGAEGPRYPSPGPVQTHRANL